MLDYYFQIKHKYLETLPTPSPQDTQLINEVFGEKVIYFLSFETTLPLMSFSVYEENLFNTNLTEFLFAQKEFKTEPLLTIKSSGYDLINTILFEDYNKFFSFIQFSEDVFNDNSKGYLQHSILFIFQNLENKEFCISSPIKMFTIGIWNQIVEQTGQSIEMLVGQIKNRILDNVIIKGLKSPHTYIRSKTCSLLGEMDQEIWSDSNQLIELCQLICNCLLEENEVTRITSLKAIEYLVSIPECIPLLKSSLSVIISKILEMLKLANMEDIIRSLYEIVKQYSDDVLEYATEIVNSLLSSFYESIEDVQEKNENEQECEYEKDETLNSLETIILTLNEILLLNLSDEFYHSSKSWVLDLISKIMSQTKLFSLTDAVLKLFNSFLFNIKTYDDKIWFFFPSMCYLILEKKDQFNPEMFSTSGLSLEQAVIISSGLYQRMKGHIPDYSRFLGKFNKVFLGCFYSVLPGNYHLRKITLTSRILHCSLIVWIN